MNRTTVMLLICVVGCQEQSSDLTVAVPERELAEMSPARNERANRSETGETPVVENSPTLTAAQLSVGAVKVNSLGVTLIPIPAGEFVMGSSAEEEHHQDDEIQHRVRITRDYYLGAKEVTQSQWQSLMGTEPWKGRGFVKEGPGYPATFVSWDAAVEFCDKLSQQEGIEYRLPTEAEWEYACRAGTSTAYSFGDDATDLVDYGWFTENTGAIGEPYAHRVGQKRPNGWGLYDMHANVWEWCSDWYDDYPSSIVTDPKGPPEGLYRVSRSGNWGGQARFCRSAFRYDYSPSLRSYPLGFRLCMDPPGAGDQ